MGNVVKLDAFDFNTDLEVTHGSCAKNLKNKLTLFSRSSHQLGHVFSTHLFSSIMVSPTTVLKTLKAIATR